MYECCSADQGRAGGYSGRVGRAGPQPRPVLAVVPARVGAAGSALRSQSRAAARVRRSDRRRAGLGVGDRGARPGPRRAGCAQSGGSWVIVVDASVMTRALLFDGELGACARAELSEDEHWAAPEHWRVEV